MTPFSWTVGGPDVDLVLSACSRGQYSQTNSNGSMWKDLDTTKLSLSFTRASSGWAIITGNADLWTANAGYNQGCSRPWTSTDPNRPTRLVWKANRFDATSNSIYAGAGPTGIRYSPTTLNALLL
jgi:hypothetical protein